MKKLITLTALLLLMVSMMWAQTNVPYYDAVAKEDKTATTATKITTATTDMTDGWYYVEEANVVCGQIIVTGDVHLILLNGSKLTADATSGGWGEAGIRVEAGNSLTIYSETANGNGELIATGNVAGAGIGGGILGSGGTVTIYGGTVSATGGTGSAGIGSGDGGSSQGSCVITGGNVGVSSMGPIPTNVAGGGAAARVYKNDITEPANAPIYVDIADASPTYPAYIYKAITDASGNATIWLPSGYNSSKVTHYMVTFNTDGGGTVATQYIIENGTATTPTPPTRDAYLFNGWYTANGTAWDFATVVTQDTTLYAKWACSGVIGDYVWQDKNVDAGDGYPYYHAMYPDTDINKATYGLLFDFESAKSACPAGWSLPDSAAITQLILAHTAPELKASGEWLYGDATNSSGLNVLPAGMYNASTDRYELLRGDAFFWTSAGEVIHLTCGCGDIQTEVVHSGNRYSVRCVKLCE